MSKIKLKIVRIYFSKISGTYKIWLESTDQFKKNCTFYLDKTQAENMIEQYSLQAVESEFTTDYVSI